MIAVIMACRNEAKHIGACLDSMLQQERPSEGVQFFIADGMSTDGTREIIQQYAKEHPGIHLIDNPRRYVSSGLNAAILASTGRIVLRMDAHTVYAKNYIRCCVETLEETGADNVGGAARTSTHGLVHRAIAACYHSRFGSGGADFHDPNFEGWVDTVTYGCWRRETLERLNMFDEEMIRNQDDELNLRLTRSGGRIWQSAKIISWYSPRASLGALFRQYFQYGFWKIAVIKKHRLPARWTHLIPGLFVLAQLGLPTLAALLWIIGEASWASLAIGAFGLMNAVYVTAALVASVAAARRNGFDLLPILPFTFGVYHFAYGLGFLCGVVRAALPAHIGSGSGRFTSEITR